MFFRSCHLRRKTINNGAVRLFRHTFCVFQWFDYDFVQALVFRKTADRWRSRASTLANAVSTHVARKFERAVTLVFASDRRIGVESLHQTRTGATKTC